MSAAVAAAVKKIAIYILGDEHKRGKLFVAVGRDDYRLVQTPQVFDAELLKAA